MAVTPAILRANFPEFASTTVYPDATVTFWLTLVYKLMSPARWGDILDEGAQLWVAHNLVLEAQATKAAASGAAPGINTGPVNSKSVGPASMAFDTTSASIEGAGNFNLTTYGTRFVMLRNMVGAGPIQVSC